MKPIFYVWFWKNGEKRTVYIGHNPEKAINAFNEYDIKSEKQFAEIEIWRNDRIYKQGIAYFDKETVFFNIRDFNINEIHKCIVEHYPEASNATYKIGGKYNNLVLFKKIENNILTLRRE